MKTNYTRILVSLMVLSITLLFGCKKNDEVNSDFIEQKLSGDSAQKWTTPIILDGDGSSSPTSYITFYNNHTFDYSGGIIFTGGSWNANYAANRSGQIVNLDFTYSYNTTYYRETYFLKYSSENDIIYAIDEKDASLVPFEKYTFAP